MTIRREEEGEAVIGHGSYLPLPMLLFGASYSPVIAWYANNNYLSSTMSFPSPGDANNDTDYYLNNSKASILFIPPMRKLVKLKMMESTLDLCL